METVDAKLPLKSTALRALRDYWRQVAGDREMPARRDLDPISIPTLLPHIVMTDVFHDPLRFRYRLLGTLVTKFYERDSTGKWLDRELYGDSTDGMLWLFRRCVCNRAPTAVRQAVPFVRKDWVTLEGLLMPLSTNGVDIDMLIGGIDFVDEPSDPKERIKRVVLDCES